MMEGELKNHLIKSLDSGVRFDGRKIDQYREVTVQYGISKNAEGSARVKIGNTEVLAGIKTEIGKPYPDSPEEGSIMVGAELLPLSSPDFEPGPPSEQAIELARVVDRGIRESKALDFKKLCIEKGEKAWIILIDIVTINDEGNLFDASALAALAALKDAYFPKLEGDIINYKELTKDKLPLSKEPIGVTVHKLGNNFIVDPTTEEESATDARLTVATMENDVLCAMQKGGDIALTSEEIDKCVEIAVAKAKELRSKL